MIAGKTIRFGSILLGLSLLVVMLVGSAAIRAARPADEPRTAKTAAAVAKANELGQVPILEYHLIGRPEGDWRRTPENFRRDLEMLHAMNYYPVRLLDYVSGRLAVPAGKSPVILTFDDSSEGQFRAIVIDGKPRPDPESAVGILEDFARRHPDFPARATFFILPGISEKLRLFGQPELRAWKLRYLVSKGYELGNHSLWHQNLAKSTPEEVMKQLALAQKAVEEYVPGYRLQSLSLPFGAWPKERGLAVSGSYQGVSYHHRAIMLVGSGPAPSPIDRDFNPLALPRIQAGDGVLGPEQSLARLDKKAYGRFVSDGDAKIFALPAALKDRLRPDLDPKMIRLIPAPSAATR